MRGRIVRGLDYFLSGFGESNPRMDARQAGGTGLIHGWMQGHRDVRSSRLQYMFPRWTCSAWPWGAGGNDREQQAVGCYLTLPRAWRPILPSRGLASPGSLALALGEGFSGAGNAPKRLVLRELTWVIGGGSVSAACKAPAVAQARGGDARSAPLARACAAMGAARAA